MENSEIRIRTCDGISNAFTSSDFEAGIKALRGLGQSWNSVSCCELKNSALIDRKISRSVFDS